MNNLTQRIKNASTNFLSNSKTLGTEVTRLTSKIAANKVLELTGVVESKTAGKITLKK